MGYSCRNCGLPVPMITHYQWQNIQGRTREVFFTDNCWVFSKAESEKSLEEHRKIGCDIVDSSGYIIETRQTPLPDVADLIKWIYFYYIQKYIAKRVSHQDPRMWTGLADKYFSEAKSSIDSREVNCLLKKLMSKLEVDIRIGEPDQYCILLISRMINSALLHDLKEEEEQKDGRSEFCQLFDELYADMNM